MNCNDIFSLKKTNTTCSCGETSGYYNSDNLNAVYSGENAIPIGIRNDTFIKAVINQPAEGLGKEFTAFVIPKNCSTFKQSNGNINSIA